MTILTLGLIVSLCLFGCSSSNQKGNGVISSEGAFQLSGTGDKLHISTKNQLVVLRVETPDSEPVIFDEKASTFSKWSVFWEEKKERLWFNSSDVGLFLYTKEESGSYSKQVITTASTEIRSIPLAFYESLPQTLKNMIQTRAQTGTTND